MKNWLLLVIMLFASQLAISQIACDNNIEANVDIALVPAATEVYEAPLPAPPAAPTISFGTLKVGKYCTFRATSYGATEFEWRVQPEYIVSDIKYYSGTRDMDVLFNTSYSTAHIVCRAKNSEGWGEYTVISVDILP